MEGMIRFSDNIWEVPPDTPKNIILNIDEDQYIVPATSILKSEDSISKHTLMFKL